MQTFLTVTMWIVLGLVCAYYAKKQQRNPILWFCMGLLLGIFGLILLLLLPLIQRIQKKSASKKQPPTPAVIDVAPPSPLSSILDPLFSNTLWYYMDQTSSQKGPMSFTALENDWKDGKLLTSSYIWNEKLADWKLFSELFPTAEKEIVQ